MVQASTQQADTEFDTPVDDCYYHIDVEQYDRDNASLEFTIWQRLCWDGSCRLCKGRSGPKPIMPVKMRNSKSLWAAIKHCGKQDSYILANMSVTEVVFRILLRNGNEPMRLSEIIDEIVVAWEEVIVFKTITPGALQQMLDNGNEYRIRRTGGHAE